VEALSERLSIYHNAPNLRPSFARHFGHHKTQDSKMTREQPYSWLLASSLLCLLNSVHCQKTPSPPFTQLTDAIPQLKDLETNHIADSPPPGRQNFTLCCIKAVGASYTLQGDNVDKTPNDFTHLSFPDFISKQFPCGATYAGSATGAPHVTVPYSWCHDNCGGWEKSHNSNLNQWVQPFVGFILPAAVFCLNVRTLCLIPRKISLDRKAHC